MPSSRRSFLIAFLTLPLIHAARNRAFAQAGSELPLTLECRDADDVTLEREAGPFFRPNSPQNRELHVDAPGASGSPLPGSSSTVAAGRLQEASWRSGWRTKTAYDSIGFRLRGHQFTDVQGRWWFNTIVPAFYPGRTRHFHFKVQRPGGRVLTTQL